MEDGPASQMSWLSCVRSSLPNMWRMSRRFREGSAWIWPYATYRSTPHNSLASPQALPPITAVRDRSQRSSSARSPAASPLFAGQIAFTALRSPLIRAAIALLFALPAAVAGYHAALGLAHIGISAEGWRHAVAVTGAIVVAATAWARMALSARPVPDRALPPA